MIEIQGVALLPFLAVIFANLNNPLFPSVMSAIWEYIASYEFLPDVIYIKSLLLLLLILLPTKIMYPKYYEYIKGASRTAIWTDKKWADF